MDKPNYFNIPIYDDIMYLLGEIGQNCKVNNVPATCILNNTNDEHDSKKLITSEELKRGYYINYANLYSLVMDDITSQRHFTYYKAKIRKCNYSINFIVAEKLYQFPSIVESEKFRIDEGKYISLALDTLSVTLPSTTMTKQIKRNLRFIKFGQAWKITGIDYTKDGLIIIHSQREQINPITDDLTNKIADRWVNDVDVLDGNITPILPFVDDKLKLTENDK